MGRIVVERIQQQLRLGRVGWEGDRRCGGGGGSRGRGSANDDRKIGEWRQQQMPWLVDEHMQ